MLDVELEQLTEKVRVFLDTDDIDHAIRHMGGTVHDVQRLSQTKPVVYRRLVHEPPEHAWRLVRRDENGEQLVVASGLTHRDAVCRMTELEARRHKQTYWIEPT